VNRPTATRLRTDVEIPALHADGATLYQLTVPLKAYPDDPGTDHVVIYSRWVDNGEHNPPDGPHHETDLFAADADGTIADLVPLPGSNTASDDHAAALDAAGYDLT
jgi:hypothetical protein